MVKYNGQIAITQYLDIGLLCQHFIDYCMVLLCNRQILLLPQIILRTRSCDKYRLVSHQFHLLCYVSEVAVLKAYGNSYIPWLFKYIVRWKGSKAVVILVVCIFLSCVLFLQFLQDKPMGAASVFMTGNYPRQPVDEDNGPSLREVLVPSGDLLRCCWCCSLTSKVSDALHSHALLCCISMVISIAIKMK